jgi:non-ribosomal peptide synthetase component E (peptide arylation enzyme)
VTLGALLARAALRRPEAEAVVDGGRRLTYAELDARAAAAAVGFHRLGVGRGGLTAATLDRHCRTSGELASFKRPRRFVFVREIPKTASGKILRRLLRGGQFTEVRP